MKIGKIEKGLTLPKKKVLGDKYGFGIMEVGDSVLISPDDAQDALMLYNRVKSAANIWSKRNGKKLWVRTELTGFRVYRTE